MRCRMIQTKSNIVLNESLNENVWRIVLEASGVASTTKPGQFIMLRISETNDPLFRRPFSVFRRVKLNQDSLGVELVYKIVGRGTSVMTRLRPGDELDIIGPLGHGFEWHRDKPVHVLLAGGTGSASLFMLGEEISKAQKENGIELNFLFGAESKKSLILEKDFKTMNAKVMVSTEDGTYGYHGVVTEMLKEALDRGQISSHCAIYASGPEPMLKALVPICKQYGIPTQVSMERHMMCGIGACLACVCKIDPNRISKRRDLESSHIQVVEGSDFGYALVCKDGPVFDLHEVIFDE